METLPVAPMVSTVPSYINTCGPFSPAGVSKSCCGRLFGGEYAGNQVPLTHLSALGGGITPLIGQYTLLSTLKMLPSGSKVQPASLLVHVLKPYPVGVKVRL